MTSQLYSSATCEEQVSRCMSYFFPSRASPLLMPSQSNGPSCLVPSAQTCFLDAVKYRLSWCQLGSHHQSQHPPIRKQQQLSQKLANRPYT